MILSSEIEITHKLQKEDLENIVDLHRWFYAKEFAFGEPFVQYVKTGLNDFYERYDYEKDRAWICRKHQKLKGFLLLIHHDELTVQLRYFILSDGVRGFGIGKKWMEEFIAFMHAKKYIHAFLYTTSELTTAAHLYTSAGFTLTESIPTDRFGKTVIEQRYDLWL